MTSIIDKLIDLIQKPIFWATASAIFASFINLLLFLINRKTFKLLYEKPHIHIKKITIKPKHQGPAGEGMIPDGTYIEMEIINPSSFQNLIISRDIYFFPFLKPFIHNEANNKIDPFCRHRLPLILESNPFDKYKNKLVKIELKDIKNRKITKYCLLRDQ